MKTLIVALNSRYIHSSLAPWYLKAACDEACGEVIVKEFSINENLESVLSAIYSEKADIVAFSSYIWNIALVHKLAENLKKLQPGICIIFGGPEVSYDSEELMLECNYVDYVLSGEGEIPFAGLLVCLNLNSMDKLANINGLTYRDESNNVICNASCNATGLDSIKSPYTLEMLDSIKGKIAYFETSRGCPFSCSYCLSSTTRGVRFFPMDRIKGDLARLARAGVRQVKFVDRTFNCNKERAKEILGFILETYCSTPGMDDEAGKINYHFEASADLFDEEMLQILSLAPAGLFQLEIGIQTMNEITLEAVCRKMDFAKACTNIKRILEPGNIHLHLDLIAGLPNEDFKSFKKSFDMVYHMAPHTLQLGFLKLLKGSAIRKDAGRYGYVYRSYAPYEVLCNNHISYSELAILKEIEELVDRFYNSGRFKYSLEYFTGRHFISPFDFYLDLRRYNTGKGYIVSNMPVRELFTLLLEYSQGLNGINMALFKDLIKLDFLASDNSGHLPQQFERIGSNEFRDKCFDFLKDKTMISRYMPEFDGIPAKQIFKKVHFEMFSHNVPDGFESSGCTEPSVLLFNYTRKNPVTSRYEFFKIDLL